MKSFFKHLSHYLPLVGIIAVGVIGIIAFSYDKFFQAAIGVSVACAYVVWGVIHHHLHKDLHLSVIIEYIIIAALGVLVLFSVLYRA